jgi:catechol 2,3-dioxygenase-like lactoylglutathione lyase family enzyme
MTDTLDTVENHGGNGSGPLSDCVQIAYVTTDLERARALFETTFGIREWMRLGVSGAGSVIRTADGKTIVLMGLIAYVGGTQFELIEPIEDPDAIYRAFLPTDGSFVVRFHHLGFSKATRESVIDLRATMELQHPVPLVAEGAIASVFYADVRAHIGHYLEYFSVPAAFDAAIPRN